MDGTLWIALAAGAVIGIIICLIVRLFTTVIGSLIVDQTNPAKDVWQIAILEDLDKLARSKKKHVYLRIIRVTDDASK